MSLIGSTVSSGTTAACGIGCVGGCWNCNCWCRPCWPVYPAPYWVPVPYPVPVPSLPAADDSGCPKPPGWQKPTDYVIG